ncbi:hypothetical protein A0H81_05528 [Grifola frondosa]|uniref:Gylcosyl hydrolase 115 C-terminal domain-containing protein n=1 Tax=Grifola frondosa TaxID=5627 RepID=A0A1C7MDC7_GRIFR|nr:hypothetical protein A0H81_05528 [Grifola frondosa]
MLRIKANYLWPAMWTSAFGIDDAQNQALADWWGIVMGTSHEEPIMRSTPVEWDLFGSGPWDYGVNAQNIYNFWVIGANRSKTYENIFTMACEVQAIRQLLTDVLNVSDITTVTQVWTLYKEVEGYYEDGMRVPDDVILLWTDDNFGNVRRYPLVSERNRTGGSGVYYHVDYVGEPRNYKWITSSQISKTYEQMSAAVARDAVRIWVLNVGDLKPYELHTEFFMMYGWDASLWNRNNLDTFVSSWAQREFDLSVQDATEVTDIIANVTRWNARRKPELLNSTTYSLTNYREAENVLAGWESVSNASTRIYNSLSSAMQPAFFQLVHHPCRPAIRSPICGSRLASTICEHLKHDLVRTITSLRWRIYSSKIMISRSIIIRCSTENGGHNFIVIAQPAYGQYDPFTTKVQSKKQALPGAMRIVIEGRAVAWPEHCGKDTGCPNPSVSIDPFVPAGNLFFDVGAGGPTPFTFTATSNASWLKLSSAEGSISQLSRTAHLRAQPPMSQVINFVANHTVVPSGFKGFVEGDGTVSIEAAHAARNTSVDGLTWVELPGIGRTLSGVTPWPRGGDDRNFTAGSGPSIEYDFYTFNTQNQTGNITVTTYVSPSLNSLGDDRPLAIAMQIDSGALQTNYFVPPASGGNLPPQWDGNDGWAANSIISVPMVFTASSGAHTLKLFMIEPSVVVQKIVIDTGGVLPSYLGPPESILIS